MKTSKILYLLKDYIILSIKIIIPVLIIYLIGYGLVYKTILKGKKTIKKRRVFLYAISICYVVIVIGATFLTRTSSDTYNLTMNLNLFSSYIEAYHEIGIVLANNVLLRNLILNIMLFIPLGVLIPLYSNKLKKLYIVIFIGILATLTIEFTQHFNGYGTFEIDDAFNNTLGAIIGYCLFMIFYKLKNKEHFKKVIGYTIPIIVTIILFVGIVIFHRNQEFGNFEFENNYTIDMKNVEVKSEIEFSKARSKKEIYQTEILTKSVAKGIAVNLFQRKGWAIDENIDKESENLIAFKPVRNSVDEIDGSIVVYYIGGAYAYSDTSNITVNSDRTISFVNQVRYANRQQVEMALQKLGIQVPSTAKFEQNENGQYLFSIDMKKNGDKLVNGNLKCNYYEDDTVKYVYNQIINYEKVMEKEIMSEEEAFTEILKGKFKAYTVEEINSIVIKDIVLEYQTDSKGFFVPVYRFDVCINEKTNVIYIKAIKNK